MLFPETGRFGVLHPPLNGPVTVNITTDFPRRWGQGLMTGELSARHRLQRRPHQSTSKAEAHFSTRGVVGSTGTVSLNDSLTYDSAPAFPGIQQVTVMAQNQSRPVIRFTPPLSANAWVFTGNADSSLVLEGLFVSGGDMVLRGQFASVTLTCCTLDPGNTPPQPSQARASPPAVFAQSIDGRDLTPTRLWIEAEIQTLTIDRCILGPIRTRGMEKSKPLRLPIALSRPSPPTTLLFCRRI